MVLKLVSSPSTVSLNPATHFNPDQLRFSHFYQVVIISVADGFTESSFLQSDQWVWLQPGHIFTSSLQHSDREISSDREGERGRSPQRKGRERVWIKASRWNSHLFSLWSETERQREGEFLISSFDSRETVHLSVCLVLSPLSCSIISFSFSSFLPQSIYLRTFSPLILLQ